MPLERLLPGAGTWYHSGAPHTRVSRSVPAGGGELLGSGVGLVAVTAPLVNWVAVGIVQLPAETLMLGRCFAVYRNLVCFAIAFVITILKSFPCYH